MINKKTMVFLISLILICLTISGVSATDENSTVAQDTQIATDIQSVEQTETTENTKIINKIETDTAKSAATYYVSTNGKSTNSGDQNNPLDLVSAVNQAKRNNGGNIILNGGTYQLSSYLGLTSAGTYTISGQTGQTVTLDGQRKSKIMWISNGANIELKNIIFANAQENGLGAAIRLDGTSTLKITNCTFKNNQGSNGGVIYSSTTSSLDISDSTFESNTATGSAGAINVNNPNAKITKNTFINNQAAELGGAILLNANGATISDNTFTQNSAKIGGAIYNNGGNNQIISQNTFTKNTAKSTSGAIYNKGVSSITNNIFTENSADDAGAILNIETEGTTISNNKFNKNTATSGAGGAITNNKAKKTIISNNDFVENTAKFVKYGSGNGGALMIYSGSNGITISNNNFTSNKAEESGAAISLGSDETTVSGNKFIQNSANHGSGAMYVEANNVNITNNVFSKQNVVYDGGAVFIRGNNTNILNNQFTENTAGRTGAAIYIDGNKNTINYNTITNNNAKQNGAGIFNNENDGTIIRGNTISNNTAGNLGGAIANNKITGATIISNTIEYNTASYAGGAIANNDISSTTIAYNTINYNSATYYGGAVITYAPSSSVTVRDNSFTSNKAGQTGGAIMTNGTNNKVNNNNFTENTVTKSTGSAVTAYGTGTTILNNNFIKNVANDNVAAIRDYGSQSTVSNNVNDKTSTAYGTIYNGGTKTVIQNNVFTDKAPDEKTATVVTVQTVKGVVGDKITLTANVKDAKGNAVTGGNLVFKINGITVKTDGTLSKTGTPNKISVKNGVVTLTITGTKNIRAAKNLTATYSGSSNYYANTSSNKATVELALRTATIKVQASPSTQEQYGTIKFTATITDSVNNKAPTTSADSYVFFKVNGKTLKDANGNNIKAKISNGVATYDYVVPAGMSAITKDGKTRYYEVTAGFVDPNYYPTARNTTKFNVLRKDVTLDFKVTVNKEFKTKSIIKVEGTIKDFKGNNVIGNNTISIKVNAKTYSTFKAVNGVFTQIIQLPFTDINIIKNITMVTGARMSYNGARLTTTDYTIAAIPN